MHKYIYVGMWIYIITKFRGICFICLMCLHMYVCTYTNVYVYIHMKEKANVTKFNNLIGVSRCWRYDVHFSIIATFLRFKAFQNEKMGRKYRKSSFL